MSHAAWSNGRYGQDELRAMIAAGEDMVCRLRARADEIEEDVRRLRGELKAYAIPPLDGHKRLAPRVPPSRFRDV